jgi:outer membrane assembly lipoprotein YfiO
MKKILIIGLCLFSLSVQARKKTDGEPLGGIGPSLTLSSILPQSKTFSLKKEIDPSRPQIFVKKKKFSKDGLKAIKDEFKTLTYRKDAKSLTDKEMKHALLLCLELGWYDKSLFYVDKLLARIKDSIDIKNYKLVRSDILFEQGDLKYSLEAYSEYLSLYPGSKHAEYVHYKKTLCAFYQTLSSDRDQEPTKEAIKLADGYIEKGKAYKKYTIDIKEIKSHCLALLYENEAHIFEFYLKRKSFKAADKRLVFMKHEFINTIPASQANLLQLECRLAYAQGDTDRYESRLALLEKKFPHYLSSTRVTQNSTKKTDHVSKF